MTRTCHDTLCLFSTLEENTDAVPIIFLNDAPPSCSSSGFFGDTVGSRPASTFTLAHAKNGSVDAHELDACTVASSPLALARNLRVPLATDVLDAEFEHSIFWEVNGPLLRDAWKEWEEDLARDASWGGDVGDDVIITDELSVALEDAFDDPSRRLNQS